MFNLTKPRYQIMNMKRYVLPLAVVAVFALAGCGGGSTSTPDDPAPPAADAGLAAAKTAAAAAMAAAQTAYDDARAAFDAVMSDRAADAGSYAVAQHRLAAAMAALDKAKAANTEAQAATETAAARTAQAAAEAAQAEAEAAKAEVVKYAGMVTAAAGEMRALTAARTAAMEAATAARTAATAARTAADLVKERLGADSEAYMDADEAATAAEAAATAAETASANAQADTMSADAEAEKTAAEGKQAEAEMKLAAAEELARRAPTPPPAAPSSFLEGSAPHVYADTVADTVASKSTTTFRPVSVGLRRQWGDNPGVSPSITGGVIGMREHADGSATATFTDTGPNGTTTRTITFPAENYASQTFADNHVRIGDAELELMPATLTSPENEPDKEYYRLNYWGACWRTCIEGFISYGTRTQIEYNVNIQGTASYNGYMYGHYFANDGKGPSWRTHQKELWSKIGLTANLDDLTISGESIDEGDDNSGVWIRGTQESGRQWKKLPNTTSITISEASIEGGRYTTTWAGQDTDANNPRESSARGWGGILIGDFYGPNAEETAGVFEGRRPAAGSAAEEFIAGRFGAEKVDD